MKEYKEKVTFFISQIIFICLYKNYFYYLENYFIHLSLDGPSLEL